jgi:hypothetical protein
VVRLDVIGDAGGDDFAFCYSTMPRGVIVQLGHSRTMFAGLCECTIFLHVAANSANVVAVICQAMIFARGRQLGKFYC